MEWKNSICYECYTYCPISVGVEDGVIVHIKGRKDFPCTEGRMCPKGRAAAMRVYDPNSLKKPLKRTNPQKGKGVDPKWVEVSWDEALTIAAQQLQRVREANPRGLRIGSMDISRDNLMAAWGIAFGTEPFSCGFHAANPAGIFCGSSWHVIGWFMHGSFVEYADYENCRYFLMVGSSQGHEAEQGYAGDVKRMADARLRGMKLVVVDPRLSNAAAKADEWIPIKPGTDGAFGLALLNVLIHELRVWDGKFLKHHTNAVYLLDEDGRYVRDPANGKPQVWDSEADEPRPFDVNPHGDLALTGEYRAQDVRCKPSFQVLSDHVKQYSPEWAESLTTVPASTIRRVAKQLAEESQIGSFIEVEGHLWPFRPVAIAARTGVDSSARAGMAGRAFFQVAALLGILSVPGGNTRLALPATHGVPPYLLPANRDGIALDPALDLVTNLNPSPQWPAQTYSLKEFFPFTINPNIMHYLTGEDPTRFGLGKQQAFIFDCTNPMHGMGETGPIERTLEQAFVVVMDHYVTETAMMADIVFPSAFGVERSSSAPVAPSGKYVGWEYCEPAIQPMYERRDFFDFLMDLGERMGFLKGAEGFNSRANETWGLSGEDALSLDQKYSWCEIAARLSRKTLPLETSWEELRQTGWWTRVQTAEERYMPYRGGRIPFYLELFQSAGEKLQKGMEKINFSERTGLKIDFSEYAALPSWKPGPHHEPDGEYDLQAISYKPPMLTFGRSAFNPWLMEVAGKLPHTSIWMHPKAAEERGIVDGDIVQIESRWGKTRGKVKLTEGIHPECLAFPGVLGHRVDHPVARGKGPHLNSLLPLDFKYMEHVFLGLDNKVRVKVRPVRSH